MTSSVRRKALAFYGLNVVMLVLIMTQTLRLLVPHGVATEIGHNSEAFAIAILVGVTIQWLRPAARRSGRPWLVMGGVAGVFLLVALLLRLTPDISGSVTTLNEAFLAAGVIALYVQLPRPLAAAPFLFAAMFLAIVVFNRTGLVTTQAEGLVACMLAPISFDVADPTILDQGADDRPRARALWCLLLVLIPLMFAVLFRVHLPSIVAEAARYGRRPTEAFIGLFLVHMYFSYALGVAWRGRGLVRSGTIRRASA